MGSLWSEDEFVSFLGSAQREYNNLPFEELRRIAHQITNINIFRATQYDTYRKDGYVPGFSRGTGLVGDFIDMTIRNTQQVLLLHDQIKPEVVRKEIEKKEKFEKYVIKLDAEEKCYQDYNWFKVREEKETPRFVYELKLLLKNHDKTIPLHFEPVTTFQFIHVCKTYDIPYTWNDINQAVVKCGSEHGEVPSLQPHNSVRVIYRGVTRVESAIKTICDVTKVLICDERIIFRGYDCLKPTGQGLYYQVCSNFPFEGHSQIDFGVRCDNFVEQINPEIVVKFSQFCFVGLDAVKVMKFLMFLDLDKKNRYCSIGIGAPPPIFSDKPVLFLVSDYTIPYRNMLRDDDVVYDCNLRREMGKSYLNKILPYMGLVHISDLEQFGFKIGGKILNARTYQGRIFCATEMTELQVNFPYVMKNPKFELFTYDTGQRDGAHTVIISKLFGEFYSLVVKNCGVISLSTSCAHPNYISIPSIHKHQFHVVKKTSVPVETVLIAPRRADLSALPFITSVETITTIMKHKFRMFRQSVSSYVLNLHYDPRVRVSDCGLWVLNPISKVPITGEDLAYLMGRGGGDVSLGVYSLFGPLIGVRFVLKGLVAHPEFDSESPYVYKQDDRYYFNYVKVISDFPSSGLLSCGSLQVGIRHNILDTLVFNGELTWSIAWTTTPLGYTHNKKNKLFNCSRHKRVC